MRGSAACKWLKRDGLLIVVLNRADAASKFTALQDYLRSQMRTLSLESAVTHGETATYQFAFSGLKCDVSALEAGMGGIAAIDSTSILLDRPGGIK